MTKINQINLFELKKILNKKTLILLNSKYIKILNYIKKNKKK